MTRKERQAQEEHPRLYALGQHEFTKWLHGLVWTPKAEKVARKHVTAISRAYSGTMTPRMIVVNIHAGAHVHF